MICQREVKIGLRPLKKLSVFTLDLLCYLESEVLIIVCKYHEEFNAFVIYVLPLT